jgi:predicted TIM-barrel fold metal-dependent hydrolase
LANALSPKTIRVALVFPYETMDDACARFDNALLCHNDALKIGRENARRLFASTIR